MLKRENQLHPSYSMRKSSNPGSKPDVDYLPYMKREASRESGARGMSAFVVGPVSFDKPRRYT